MTRVEVILEGCDDETRFTIECSDNEIEFLERLSALANDTSEYCCMPRMFVKEADA